MLPKIQAESYGHGVGVSAETPSHSRKESKRWRKEQRKRHRGKNGPEDRGQRRRKEEHLRKEGEAEDRHEQQPAEVFRCSGKVQTCKDINDHSDLCS